MFSLTPIQQLRRLDKSSPQFPGKLTRLLHGQKYRRYVGHLQDSDSLWLVEYLDDVLGTLQPDSHAFCACFRELWAICGNQRVLPQSHVLPSSSLSVVDHPFATRGPFDVFEAFLNGTRVAVKKLRVYSRARPKEIEQAFFREIVIWKRLSHPNIVPILGVTTGPLQSASSLELGVELLEYVTTRPQADRLGPLFDVTKGLCYLHSRGMAHGDLKGSSVLVDDAGTARLTDFGFSRVASYLDPAADVIEGHAVRWAAPEILDTAQPVSEASDIYSFAMVVIEAYTGKVPFHNRIPAAVVVDVLSGRRPERPMDPNLSDELWNLVERSWSRDPRERPRSSEVLFHMQAAFSPRLSARVSWDDSTLRSLEQEEPSEGLCYPPLRSITAFFGRWRGWESREVPAPQSHVGGHPLHEVECEKGVKSPDVQHQPRTMGYKYVSKDSYYSKS